MIDKQLETSVFWRLCIITHQIPPELEHEGNVAASTHVAETDISVWPNLIGISNQYPIVVSVVVRVYCVKQFAPIRLTPNHEEIAIGVFYLTMRKYSMWEGPCCFRGYKQNLRFMKEMVKNKFNISCSFILYK